MLHEQIILHRRTAYQMFLNDAFQNIRRAGVVPDAFGINECDGPLLTYPQTVSLGSVDSTLARQAEFIEAGFQVVPGFEACRLLRAFWLGLIAAQEDMALDATYFQG